jgi:hypothetical protein
MSRNEAVQIGHSYNRDAGGFEGALAAHVHSLENSNGDLSSSTNPLESCPPPVCPILR